MWLDKTKLKKAACGRGEFSFASRCFEHVVSKFPSQYSSPASFVHTRSVYNTLAHKLDVLEPMKRLYQANVKNSDKRIDHDVWVTNLQAFLVLVKNLIGTFNIDDIRQCVLAYSLLIMPVTRRNSQNAKTSTTPTDLELIDDSDIVFSLPGPQASKLQQLSYPLTDSVIYKAKESKATKADKVKKDVPKAEESAAEKTTTIKGKKVADSDDEEEEAEVEREKNLLDDGFVAMAAVLQCVPFKLQSPEAKLNYFSALIRFGCLGDEGPVEVPELASNSKKSKKKAKIPTFSNYSKLRKALKEMLFTSHDAGSFIQNSSNKRGNDCKVNKKAKKPKVTAVPKTNSADKKQASLARLKSHLETVMLSADDRVALNDHMVKNPSRKAVRSHNAVAACIEGLTDCTEGGPALELEALVNKCAEILEKFIPSTWIAFVRPAVLLAEA